VASSLAGQIENLMRQTFHNCDNYATTLNLLVQNLYISTFHCEQYLKDLRQSKTFNEPCSCLGLGTSSPILTYVSFGTSQPQRGMDECLLGSIATSSACLFTNPLEVVKTRLQLQGELRARGEYTIKYRNVFHAFYAIAEADGISALQRGLVPAIWYQVFMNGPRLGVYQILDNAGVSRNSDGEVVFLRRVAMGAFSGALGAFVGSPFYLVKTRLQSRATASVAVGYQHNHTTAMSALIDVYKTGGIAGLWAGVNAAVPRVMVGSAAQLSTFSTSKKYIDSSAVFPYDNHILANFVAASISGVAVVATMTPFDVVSTRLYNQPNSNSLEQRYYKGFWDCVMKIAKKEGLLAFYKGWTASLLRSAPHTVLSLIFWDELRKKYIRLK